VTASAAAPWVQPPAVRLRYCLETKAYIQGRQADDLSKREAIRCVKRYVARQTYHAIRADLAV
jgi:transposase